MKFYTILIYFLVFGEVCFGQKKHKVHIINKSSFIIDSVYFQAKKIENDIKTSEIGINELKSIEIIVSAKELLSEGIFIMDVFQRDKKKYRVFFGLHDLGRMEKKEDSVFIFDHSYTHSSKPIKKPDRFVLFLSDQTSLQIDSFQSSALRKVSKTAERGYKLEFDYATIEKKPVFKILQKGKSIEIVIAYDWDRWAFYEIFNVVYDYGVCKIPENY
jgi:hypothetical protein